MDSRQCYVARHPGRVLLREQLTRLVADLGGTGKTAEVMVTRADVAGPLSHLVLRTEPKGCLAYCIEGALRLECVSDAGANRIVSLAAAEEFIPRPASLCRRGYRVRMSPHESATMATWSPAALREILLTVPESGMLKFLDRTQLGWTPHRERWAILSMLEAPERIAVVLGDLVARFGVPHEAGVQITVPLVDRHIAALIGTNRERVNRCLNALIRERLVRRLPNRRLWVSHAFLGQTRGTTSAGTATSAPS